MQFCKVQWTEHIALGSAVAQCDGAGGGVANSVGPDSSSQKVQVPYAEGVVRPSGLSFSQLLWNDCVECLINLTFMNLIVLFV